MFNYELMFKEVERKGLKLGYVAEQIGISRQRLSVIKNHGGELSATQVAIIASILRSPLDMFIKEVE